jgi:hypothetical protein
VNWRKTWAQPYPVVSGKWPTALGISLFVALFILLFQPFGLSELEHPYKIMLLTGYGWVTLLFMWLYTFLLPAILPKAFAEESWTVGKQIVILCLIITSIASGNYLYSAATGIVGWSGTIGLVVFFFFTLTVAIIPVTALTLIAQNIALRRNLKTSNHVNDMIAAAPAHAVDSEVSFQFDPSGQEVPVRLSDLFCVESVGNYLHVYFRKGEQTEKLQIRRTLKSVEENLKDSRIFKCHRAFLVNTERVTHVSGNSQGYTLTLDGCEKEVPVARAYTAVFRAVMQKRV